MFAGAMVVAMAADAAFGWPEGWYARIGHPVTWIGRMIRFADEEFTEGPDPALRRRRGAVAAVAIVAGADRLMDIDHPSARDLLHVLAFERERLTRA